MFCIKINNWVPLWNAVLTNGLCMHFIGCRLPPAYYSYKNKCLFSMCLCEFSLDHLDVPAQLMHAGIGSRALATFDGCFLFLLLEQHFVFSHLIIHLCIEICDKSLSLYCESRHQQEHWISRKKSTTETSCWYDSHNSFDSVANSISANWDKKKKPS